MHEHPDLGLRTSSVAAAPCAGVVLYATAEDVEYAAALAELDRADRESEVVFYDADLDAPPVWDVDAPGDEDLVAALSGRVGAADLLLLDSIDPGSLAENLNRVGYLRALDRVEALVAAKRQDVLVAMVGPVSSQAYLPEVHLEHEISVARRTSRYAAGRAIEVARALATTFPGFATALRVGEVSEAHCKVLVEKTRVVADERFWPSSSAGCCRRRAGCRWVSSGARSRRRSPGWIGTPPGGRSGRGRPGGSGRGSSRTGWATSGSPTTGRRSRRWPTPSTRAGAACRSPAVGPVRSPTVSRTRPRTSAARTRWPRSSSVSHEDGSVSWDREQVAVIVNVVLDLPTLRGEADQIALVDGQPVPGEIGRVSTRGPRPGGGGW